MVGYEWDDRANRTRRRHVFARWAMFAIAAAATLCVVLIISTGSASAMGVCTGGDRAERKLTCIVDGDTGWDRSVKWRMLGIDTPEISSPECEAEYAIGITARDRLREMMAGGYRIEWSGDQGSFGRDLARIRLSDGRHAGPVLIEEGLAQAWPNEGNVWCER